MHEHKTLYQDIRVFLSGCAALLASLLCHNLGHFAIVPSQPSTWLLATQHRCGWVLIATCIWFLCETTNRFVSGRSPLQRPYRS